MFWFRTIFNKQYFLCEVEHMKPQMLELPQWVEVALGFKPLCYSSN